MKRDEDEGHSSEFIHLVVLHPQLAVLLIKAIFLPLGEEAIPTAIFMA